MGKAKLSQDAQQHTYLDVFIHERARTTQQEVPSHRSRNPWTRKDHLRAGRQADIPSMQTSGRHNLHNDAKSPNVHLFPVRNLFFSISGVFGDQLRGLKKG